MTLMYYFNIFVIRKKILIIVACFWIIIYDCMTI